MSIRQPNRLKRARRSPNLSEPLLSRNVTPGLNRNPGSRPQANSAFRATNSTTQPVTANAASQIFFPTNNLIWQMNIIPPIPHLRRKQPACIHSKLLTHFNLLSSVISL